MPDNPMLFYHPCTWVIVDDQERFLRATASILPEFQSYKLFDEPKDALSYLNSVDNRTDQWLRSRSIASGEELIISLDLGQIELELIRPERFAEVSVVLADFAMPSMDGLEFFSRLDRDLTKKILLTGVADESIAIDAFNQGQIDRFISKSDPAATEKIVGYSRDLEKERFKAIQESTLANFAESNSILLDEEFIQHFGSLLEKYSIVEYYFSIRPRGYVCLDARGSAKFLVIRSAIELQRSQEILASIQKPKWVEEVARQGVIPFVFEQVENEGDYDWESNSVRIDKTFSNWSVGLHETPPLDIDYNSESHSVRAYFEREHPSIF